MIFSKKILLVSLAIFSIFNLQSQLPEKVLVGYWHNWDEGNSLPFLELNEIDDRYNVICLSFAIAKNADPTNMQFNMYSASAYDDPDLIADIEAKKLEGKKVLMSIGGATGSFRLSNSTKRDGFIEDMKTIISNYKVDGIDIDLEQRAYVCMNSGTIQTPTDVHVVNMISALQELLAWYQTTYGKKMILTMAPETVYVQGGLSSYQVNNICGASYLPIIEALRNDLDLLMVQLYNSGEMFDLDKNLAYQGTQTFITSQTEAIIKGFTAVEGLGYYSGLNPSQVAVALPACTYAGSGYLNPTQLKPALNYLLNEGPKVGSYTLKTPGGYPSLRGLMTWSINNDALSFCGAEYEYAQVFEDVFYPLITSKKEINQPAFLIFPNPVENIIHIQNNSIEQNIKITNITGQVIINTTLINNTLDISELKAGQYFLSINNQTSRFIKK